MTLFVDPVALQSEATRLAEAATYVDTLATSIPVDTDWGVGTTAILGILSIIVESAGELSSALGGFADVLSDSADCYAEQDIAAADAINAAVWEEHR